MNMPKEIRYCIDCDEPSHPMLPSRFHQPKESYRCPACASRLTAKNPIWRDNVSKGIKNKYDTDPQYLINYMAGREKMVSNPNWKENVSAGIQNKFDTDIEYRNKNITAMQKRAQDPIWSEQNKIRSQLRSQNMTYIENHKNGCRKRSQKESWRENNRTATQSIGRRTKISAARQGVSLEDWLDFAKNGKYCGLWTDPKYKVKKRVRARYRNCCIICGKTREQHNNRHMIVHHVYRNKGACCCR